MNEFLENFTPNPGTRMTMPPSSVIRSQLHYARLNYRDLLSVWILGSTDLEIKDVQNLSDEDLKKYEQQFRADTKKYSMTLKAYENDPEYKNTEFKLQKKEENNNYWGKVMANAYIKMNQVTFPPADKLKTPEDQAAFIASEAGLVSAVSGTMGNFLNALLWTRSENFDFINAFQKNGMELSGKNGCEIFTPDDDDVPFYERYEDYRIGCARLKLAKKKTEQYEKKTPERISERRNNRTTPLLCSLKQKKKALCIFRDTQGLVFRKAGSVGLRFCSHETEAAILFFCSHCTFPHIML